MLPYGQGVTDSKPYRANLSAMAHANEDFRRVLCTTKHTQLVVMALAPGEEIGEEVHEGIDQTLIAVEGGGTSVLDGVSRPFNTGDVVVVPGGTRHNFVNTGEGALKIATIYAPPDHRPGTVHHTRQDALRDES